MCLNSVLASKWVQLACFLICRKPVNDPDVLLTVGRNSTPHPVHSGVLTSASLPLKELVAKYKSKTGSSLPRIPIEVSDKPTLVLFVRLVLELNNPNVLCRKVKGFVVTIILLFPVSHVAN